MKDLEQYLQPTEVIDSNHPEIREYAAKTIGDAATPREQAVRLYYAVRDAIWYDPYTPFYRPEHYRASNVLRRGRAFCIPKASLLCAVGRACGIPSRPGFAHVKNHLATRELLEFLGSDIFAFHAFVEFFLEGKWVKATPAFNKELCIRHGVEPLEFDGREDSIFQLYNSERRKFMEYLEFLGSFADIPVDRIVEGFRQTYGAERVASWIDAFEKKGGLRPGRFESEEVV